jgi:dCTP deaminase
MGGGVMSSLLCDWEIEDAINKSELVIKPYDKSLISSNSIDMRLGDRFITYLPSDKPIDPYSCDTIEESIKDTWSAKTFIIYPGDFVLARTLEWVELPDFYAARVEGKSSLARIGLTIHQTGGWIDSGFHGTITLEISNVNRRPIILHAAMPICQLAIFLTNPPRVPYNKKETAKYSGQIDPTMSKYFKNKVIV